MRATILDDTRRFTVDTQFLNVVKRAHLFLFFIFFTLRVILVSRVCVAKLISYVCLSVCLNQTATKSNRTEPAAVLETECKKNSESWTFLLDTKSST